MVTKRKNKVKAGPNKRRRSGESSLAFFKQPASVAVPTYNGPVGGAAMRDANAPIVVTLTLVSLATATAGGVFAGFASADPTGATGWAGWAARYGDYRVLGLEVEFNPSNPDTVPTASTLSRSPIATAVSRADVTAPTSYATCMQYASSMMHSPSRKWRRVVKMDGIEESGWTVTGSAVSFFGVKFYTDTNTANAALGLLVQRYTVQFRNQL